MTLATFPTLPGQGWSLKKTPTFSTRVAQHVSGREVRAQNYAHALYHFELTFEGLDSLGLYPGLQAQSEQALRGFYLACAGQYGTFLYVDPNDNAVTNCTFGQGDGASTQFTLYRSVNGFYEPASYVTNVANAYVNGVSQPFVLLAPNTIQFASPPAAGLSLAWTGSFGWQCRFSDDSAEFENAMKGLWSLSSLKFQQVR